MRKVNVIRARRLKNRRSYTMREIAIEVGVNLRTVQTWHAEGLKPIDSDTRPMLFMGESVKSFLFDRCAKAKRPLKSDEFYCLRCRQATKSVPESISVVDTMRRIGKEDSSLHVHGKCIECGCRLNRFSTHARLDPEWRTLINTETGGTL